MGNSLSALYGALTQSQRPHNILDLLPSRCFLNPHASLKACCSPERPPNETIIPLALPFWQRLAEWYTRATGFSDLHSNLTQVNGLFSTFKHPLIISMSNYSNH